MNVGNDARTLGIARDVVEHHGRTVLHTGSSTTSGRHARLGQHLVGDVQKLALLLKRVEERTQILINLGHVYSPIQRGLRYPYVIAARVTWKFMVVLPLFQIRHNPHIDEPVMNDLEYRLSKVGENK